VAYDPEGMVNVPKYFEKLECAYSMMEAIKDADAIIIATEWEEFKAMDLIKVKALLKFPIIIDLRNILDTNQLELNGFKYYSVGRKSGK
jgi:UDPglucose 6-dehydrogenase